MLEIIAGNRIAMNIIHIKHTICNFIYEIASSVSTFQRRLLLRRIRTLDGWLVGGMSRMTFFKFQFQLIGRSKIHD